MSGMRRRKFITLLGGAAVAWPLAARAQQAALPVIGFLSAYPHDSFALYILEAFHRGLKELGYSEGRNVAIEYRWSADEYDRLPAFAADLVRSGVSVIVASTSPAVPVAKAASSTIPIVFSMGGDPVALGYVASLSHPGGNLTGVTTLNVELGPKRGSGRSLSERIRSSTAGANNSLHWPFATQYPRSINIAHLRRPAA
jgi:putative tryptophan/tyrosine transport system substrate-binding protein